MDQHNLLPFDGQMYFYPNFFELSLADALQAELTEHIHWKHESIKIMGKEVMQPRLTAWYGDEGKSYQYSGITMHPLPWTESLLQIKSSIEDVSGHTFNSALLNFYRSGSDSMGWHRDNERSLGLDPVIGSVSFGATRKFRLKHQTDKNTKLELLLTTGSFLLMKGTMQRFWYHSIPKQPKLTSPRINITFRTIITQ